MKKDWIWFAGLALCIVLIIPWSILHWEKKKSSEIGIQIRVLMPGGDVERIPLEKYLIGVVAGEMPANFEVEALKAQAITARTYAIKQVIKNKSNDKSYDVDTTVQTQVWLSEQMMRKKWGWLNYWRYYRKLESAVKETSGLVLVYHDEYIDAYYHSSSGRKPTEKAEEVWSMSRPYLQNVNSEEDNPLRYVKKFSFSPQEISMILGIKETIDHLSPKDFSILAKTAAGRAKTVRVLGKVYPASQLRMKLGLSSTDIEWAIQPKQLTITAYGNGHAVGMSQWGANNLAQKGMKVEAILNHYYPGTKISMIKQNK